MVAETKLYDLLSIEPSANDAEIKKAYKKAALKWHPDKNKDNPQAADKFRDISEAYEILSDAEKRKVYDQYGLDFLRKGGPSMSEDAGGAGGPGGFGGGMPSGFGGGMPGGFGGGMPGGATYSFSSGFPGGSRGGFKARDPFEMFNQMGGGMGGDDLFADLMGGSFGSGRSSGGGGFSSMNGTPKRKQTPEVTVVERPLPVSLEELFTGTKKKMAVTRKTFDQNTNKAATEKLTLDAPIKRGLKAGSKIKFSGVGDQIEGGTQDLHFVVQEKPHQVFKRDGDDLLVKVEIDVKESLTGWSKTIATIDGKQLSVKAGGPTGPEYTQIFPGQGMPKSKTPDQRGDLIVGVTIKFPKSLTADQKTKLKEIL